MGASRRPLRLAGPNLVGLERPGLGRRGDDDLDALRLDGLGLGAVGVAGLGLERFGLGRSGVFGYLLDRFGLGRFGWGVSGLGGFGLG